MLTQLYYWISPLLIDRRSQRASLAPEIKKKDEELKIGVSVVVCVHRDVQKLERLLKSLLAQTYPLYEIVVVNDGPDPGISMYLSKAGTLAPAVNLRIIDFDSSTKTTPGKKAPLTTGIRAAQYDWLLLTDGDCVMGPKWIAEMMRHASPGIEIVLGVAPYFTKPGFLNLLQRFDGLITAAHYLGAALRGKPFMGVGRNLLYHRSLFEKVEGFGTHAHLISGDDDLFVQSVADRNNTTVCIDSSAFVFSEAPDSWVGWIQQKRRHLSASKAYSWVAKFQTTSFVLSWMIFWIGILIIILCNTTTWFVIGMIAVIVHWLLFASTANRLTQRRLIPMYPIMAVSYCVMLCTFAILLTIPPPKTWMRS